MFHAGRFTHVNPHSIISCPFCYDFGILPSGQPIHEKMGSCVSWHCQRCHNDFVTEEFQSNKVKVVYKNHYASNVWVFTDLDHRILTDAAPNPILERLINGTYA